MESGNKVPVVVGPMSTRKPAQAPKGNIVTGRLIKEKGAFSRQVTGGPSKVVRMLKLVLPIILRKIESILCGV